MASDKNLGCSGRFVLRIDPGLHGALRKAARAAGVSLNEYCARKLATRSSSFTGLDLAADYIRRTEARLEALDVLFENSGWADVVRESQKIVELALKGLLRAHGIEPPRIHDVSKVLLAERRRLPESLQDELDDLASISRDLRRDRELAFYGAEDLTPSGFYNRTDAERARDGARRTVAAVRPHVASGD